MGCSAFYSTLLTLAAYGVLLLLCADCPLLTCNCRALYSEPNLENKQKLLKEILIFSVHFHVLGGSYFFLESLLERELSKVGFVISAEEPSGN